MNGVCIFAFIKIDKIYVFEAKLDKWIEIMMFSAISIFIVKMYNLFFFGTEETVDLDTIECAT